MQRTALDKATEDRIESQIDQGIAYYNQGEYQLAADQFILAYAELESKKTHDPISEYQWLNCRYMLTLCSYFSGTDSHTETKNKLIILLALYEIFQTKHQPKKVAATAAKELAYLSEQLQHFDEPEERASSLCNQAYFYSYLIVEKKVIDEQILSLCQQGLQLLSEVDKLTEPSSQSRARAKQLHAYFHETMADYYVDRFIATDQKMAADITSAISHYEAAIDLNLSVNPYAELDLRFSVIHANELARAAGMNKNDSATFLQNLVDKLQIEDRIAKLAETTEQDKKIKDDYKRQLDSYLTHPTQTKQQPPKNIKRKHDALCIEAVATELEPATKRIKRDNNDKSNTAISQTVPASTNEKNLMGESTQSFLLFNAANTTDSMHLLTRPVRKLLQFSAKLTDLDHSTILCGVADYSLQALDKIGSNDKLAHAICLLYECIEIMTPLQSELDGNLHYALIYFNDNYSALLDKMARHPAETTHRRKIRYADDFKRLGGLEFSLMSLTKFASRVQEALNDQCISFYVEILHQLEQSPYLLSSLNKLAPSEVKMVQEAFTASKQTLKKLLPTATTSLAM
jgi:hypothetical protein